MLPTRSGSFPRNFFFATLRQFRGSCFPALGRTERRERLRMYVLALCGLQYVAGGFLYDAECVLYRIGALTASACSGRHGSSMTRDSREGKKQCQQHIDRPAHIATLELCTTREAIEPVQAVTLLVGDFRRLSRMSGKDEGKDAHGVKH
jgi:hypothetical protein